MSISQEEESRTVEDKIVDALKDNALWIPPPKKYRGDKKKQWYLATCRTFNEFSIHSKRRNLLEVFNEVQQEQEAAQKKYSIIARRIREDPRYKAPHFKELVSRRNRDHKSRLDLVCGYNGMGTLDRVLRLMDQNRFHYLKTCNCLAVQEFINKIE